ncbi:dual specificity protein phosphatase 10-like [Acipenser oxyrinchus oxyrinchus]|uniref:protein-tyrosine-phosphatase n=1 Tax=Acipenser oxyrinchus oxyrinchus TaxID=40147 RepID=A0AAD8CGN2_ACIOX|nr:dual specificity protein phosphatase 10-like [Acipenser oxyrinchus oxyrinchus]
MPPSPLDERIVVLQRPKTLTLRLPHPSFPRAASSAPPPAPEKRRCSPELERLLPGQAVPVTLGRAGGRGERAGGGGEGGGGGGALKEQGSNGSLPLGYRHTHTIDIKLSLGLGSRAGSSGAGGLSKGPGGARRRLSLHLDLNQQPEKPIGAEEGKSQSSRPRAPPTTSGHCRDRKETSSSKENSRPSRADPRTQNRSSRPRDRHPAPAPASPSQDPSSSSSSSRALELMHPLKCGCRGCWRLIRCGEDGVGVGGPAPPPPSLAGRGGGRRSGGGGLRLLGGCLSASVASSSSSMSTSHSCLLRPLDCVPCSGGVLGSPAALGKKLGGCLPCAPLSSRPPASFRALQSCVAGGCNPSIKSVGSSCSFCSSCDPIVTYDRQPRGSSKAGSGGAPDDEDDYSVRTIWPEELAKKMTRSKAAQDQNSSSSNPLVLDCRNLVGYTRSHLQGAATRFTDAAGRRRLQQGKLAVLDFISNREGGDSLKRLWNKERIGYGEMADSSPSPSSPPLSSGPAMPTAELKDAPCRSPVPTQSLHLVLNSLNKEQEELPYREASVWSSDGDAPLPLTPDIENAALSPVLPFLFLGNERDARDLERMLRLGIGSVLNVTAHLPLYHLDSGLLRYKRLPATDSSKQNLQQYFEEAFEFIEEAHQCGQGVLIHCQAGVSRSATLVIAYLMKHTLMTMTDAYKYVKGKRPVISPNLNFMGQLLEFENDLNSGVTPRILTPKLTGLETEV